MLVISDLQQLVRKLAWFVAMSAALAGVLVMVLWFSGRQADFPSSSGAVLLLGSFDL